MARSIYFPARPESPFRRMVAGLLILAYLNLLCPLMPLFAETLPTPEHDEEHPPFRSAPHVKANRSLPAGIVKRLPDAVFSVAPTDAEIFRAKVLPENLVPVGAPTTPVENEALARALTTYEAAPDNPSPLEDFIAHFPASPWRASLELNLGLRYFATAYFSKAMDAYANAWAKAKTASDEQGSAIADRAITELLRLNARLGRVDELTRLFAELGDRRVKGASAELLAGARAGLSLMQTRPEDAFRCGPGALDRILAHQNKTVGFNDKLMTSRSTPKGMSMTQVWQLSKQVGLDYQMAKRTPGAALLTPAVIHWKVGHYAALISESHGVSHLEDPTFGADYSTTRAAIDSEASGYFLVPSGPLPAGWTPVDETEGSTVWGKGNTSANNPDATRPYDKKTCPGGDGSGMAVASAMLMTVSLNLMDTPLRYSPPAGPPVAFTLTYNQREASQPSVFDYGNVGRQWTHQWLSFIDETRSGSSGSYTYTPLVRVMGGGTEPYPASTATAATDLAGYTFPNQADSGSQLVKIDAQTYEQRNADGSKLIYGFRTGAAGTRRYFLTQIADPCGNAVTLSYDASERLVAVTDAIGQVTTLAYELPSDPLKLTKVTDPFGRFCTLTYNAAGQLQQITDILGLTSVFTYEAGTDFVDSLTTPYGTSTFAYGESGRDKWLTLTDPLGQMERVEYHDSVSTYPATGPLPSGMSATGSYDNNRNTFYWDKNAYAGHAGDVNFAHLYHWLHTALNLTSSRLENEKSPYENRVWYNYEGQTSSLYEGTTGNSTVVGRVLDNGSTQLHKYQYNSFGRLIQATDPLGRITSYIYDTNGIDLLEVRQTTGTGGQYEVLGQFTYNSQHLPLTSTDAAGQVTTYTYNPQGQLLTTTNPKAETTTLTYDADGYLLTVDGPLPGTADQTSLTYDGYGRVRTVTDPEGYTVTTDYDAFDRPTVITYPDATYAQIIYDKLDAVQTRDRLGRWTTNQYTPLRQLAIETDPLGRRTVYQWCTCGALRSLTDGNGRTTSWSRDALGRVTAKNYPDGTQWRYGYESTTSRLKTITDAKGQVTTYTYNLDDTLQQVAYTNAAIATPPVSYTYDPYYPRVLTATDGVGTTTCAYNPVPATPTLGAGRLASIDGPWDDDTIGYTYDELGRGTATSINGTTSSVAYDALGRVTSATSPLGTFGYAYVNATGRVSQITYPNGQATHYDYYPNQAAAGTGNGDQRLRQIRDLGADGSANLSTFGYTYDANGTIQTWSRQLDAATAQTTTFGYDAADQLVSAVSSAPGVPAYRYRYDRGGNRTSEQIGDAVTSAAHNAGNEAVSLSGTGPIRIAGTVSKPADVTVNGGASLRTDAANGFETAVTLPPGVNTVTVSARDGNGVTTTQNYQVTVGTGSAERTLAYDLNGNLTADGAGRSFGWDAANRLVSITQGGDVTTFVYDGLGRRVQEKLNGAEIKRWVWDGDSPAEERDATNAVTRRFYAQGEQIDGTSYYYTTDHLGSIREMTDATGAIRARYDYDPYGRRTKVSGDLEADFGFTGHYFHAASGLGLTRYRAYDSTLGRWLSRDPIAENGGLNLYAYCDNNPVNGIDPLGLSFASFLRGFGTGVAVGIGAVIVGAAVLAIAPAAVVAVLASPIVVAALTVTAVAGVGVELHNAYAAYGQGCTDEGDEIIGNLVGGLVGGAGAAKGISSLKNALQAAEGGAARTLTAPAHAFERTHGLSGNASTRNVQGLMDSMRANGWQGDAISVFEHNGSKYILDGHHRVQAAMRVGVEVPYNSVPASQLSQFGYQTADDVIRAAAEAGPVKLRVR